MKKVRIFIFSCFIMLFFVGCKQNNSTVQISDLRVNNQITPVSIDTTPFFSWKMFSEEQGQMQKAYQITVSDSEKKLKNKEYVWDSGLVENDLSVAIEYAGDKLKGDTKYFWQVTVWNTNDEKFQSEISFFEMGKLEQDWENTSWITVPQETKVSGDYLATKFTISYKFKTERTSTGFIWGADEGRYGTYNLWRFDTSGEYVVFNMLRMHNEVMLDSHTVELDNYRTEDFLQSEHEVQIEVDNNQVKTLLDGVEIAFEDNMEKTPIAAIGLYVSRGEKKAWYDDICVKLENGQVLYQDSFENERNNIFLLII